MVKFVQVGASRLYVPELYREHIDIARIGFVSPLGAALNREIDLSTSLAKGTLIVFPILTPQNANRMPQQAPQEVDVISARAPHVQIALFSSAGRLRSSEYLEIKDQRLVNSTTLYIGDPTVMGDKRWRLSLPMDASIKVVGSVIELDLDSVDADATRLYLDTGTRTYASIPKIDGRRRLLIDLDGPARGSFRFPITLHDKLLGLLGVGPRYFVADAVNPGDLLEPQGLSYPFYALGEGISEVFNVEFDFVAPHDFESPLGSTGEKRRPRSLLVPPDKPLGTYIHAVHGHEVELIPETKAGREVAGFALTASPLEVTVAIDRHTAVKASHYFSPLGAFRVLLKNNSAPQARLSLGISNLETIEMQVEGNGVQGDRLIFETGMPAFSALGKQTAESILENSGDIGLLDLSGTCVTSWVRIEKSDVGGDSLSMQPEGMQAYRRIEARTVAMGFEALRYPNPSKPFPFVPLLGIGRRNGSEALDPSVKARLLFERDVLARVRRAKILESVTPKIAVSTGATQESALLPPARTPQGYVAERFGASGPWSSLIFTKTSKRAQDDAGKVVFEDLKSVRISVGKANGPENKSIELLAKVLSHNRMMLATRWSKLKQLGFDLDEFNRFHIGGWGIDIGVSSDPIVVLKYDDRPLRALVADLRQWTLPESFAPGDLAKFQKDLLGRLPEETSADELLKPLTRRVNNPNWNGLLILDARLPFSGIPDQMRAIAATLPAEGLPVIYAGIDISGIEADQSDNQPWASAIFGLVRHVISDPRAGWSPEHSGVHMRVPKLILRVENDAIDRFECTVDLKIEKLFDVKSENAETVLNLDGRYEARVSNGKRQDTYSFSAKGNYEKTFGNPSLVSKVALRQIRLITVLVDASRTRGRFLIDGTIEFNKISAFDLLSIDALDFADLAIDLDFDGGSPKFSFDYPNLHFDFGTFNRGKGRRPGSSFLSRLPMKLRSFRIGDFNLPSLGYIGLGGIDNGPNYKVNNEFKFGFDFDLDLGSLGSLAKKLERFKLQLAIGWKPVILGDGTLDTNLFAAGFRLDLGEGAGGIDLGLEGIMRITAERFNIKKEGEVLILSADDCHLEVLGKRLPSKDQQRFSMFLFANLRGNALFDRPGWYASFEDQNPEPPIAISDVVLAQHVDVDLGEVKSTRDTLAWLSKQRKFTGATAARDFVNFASTSIKYDPNREWFIALKGDFFKVFRLAVLLKDPDVYGAYVGLLGGGAKPDSAIMSLDLLYQKLADGLGRYVVEVGLPPSYRTIDVGAAAVTIGMIRVEIFTDGGFLVDLGFPLHVDYSRSFVVQAGPFIGKGGMYIGRVPAVTVPGIPTGYGSVFRAGFAMRIGLGREFEKGPIRAGLSVSVFGRLEGYLAAREPEVKNIRPYWLRIQGEIGIIAEVEGYVDLKLIRARLCIRLWVASGILLETGKDVLLYCEAGVSVAVEVEIGSFRIFGRRISISITLRFSTTLRFEWTLPARAPELPFETKPESIAIALEGLLNWQLPSHKQLGVAQVPIDLRLAFDVTRAIRDGLPVVVLVPTVMWVTGDSHNMDGAQPREPFALLAKALIAWAALRCKPDAPDALQVKVAKGISPKAADGQIEVVQIERALRDFESVPFDMLESFLTLMLDGSRLRVVEDHNGAEGYLFPVPPNLHITLVHAGTHTDYNFAELGKVSDATAEALLADLERQFAELDQRKSVGVPAIKGAAEFPLVSHLFRNWCEALALTTMEVAQTTWKVPEGNSGEARPLGEILDLLTPAKWREIAARTGRLLLGGLRVRDGNGSVPLLERARLLIDLPLNGPSEIRIIGLGSTSWLSADSDTLSLDGPRLADLKTASVPIDKVVKRPPAIRLVARGFVLPPFIRMKKLGEGAMANFALLNRLSHDLQAQLGATSITKLAFFARSQRAQAGQSQINDDHALQNPRASMVVEMAIDRVGASQADRLPGVATSLDCVFQIAGTSEAERRPLDALFSLPTTEIARLLEESEIRLSWEGPDASNPPVLITPTDIDPTSILLARSTVSVERRPFPEWREAVGAAIVPEEIFRATLEPQFRFDLLYLLQRAAIVNSGGTYLLLPKELATPLRKLFDNPEAQAGSNGRVRLSFVLTFRPSALPPSGSVNAVLFTDADDMVTLDPTGASDPRVVMARLAVLPNLKNRSNEDENLVEAIPLRPAGTELVRVWRRRVKPSGDPDQVPTKAQLGSHLAARFDMLEFTLTNFDSGRLLLGYDQSLPLASEEAVPPNDKGYPHEIRRWLQAEKPGDFHDDDLRYDLMVPVSRLAAVNADDDGTPYAAIGARFELGLGWRDLYGNRLAVNEQPLPLKPLYTDPLVPVSAWPAVKARVYPGTPGSRQLVLELAADTESIASEPLETKKAMAQELQRVIHQLKDPRVKLHVSSGLGRVENSDVDGSVVDTFLKKIRDVLNAGAGSVPPTWSSTFTIAVETSKQFLEITLAFAIDREESLVGKAVPDEDSRPIPGVKSVCTPIRLTPTVEPKHNDASSAARTIATEFRAAFRFQEAGKQRQYWVGRGAASPGESEWWAIDDRLIPTPSDVPAVAFAPPPLARALMSAPGLKARVIRRLNETDAGYLQNTFAKNEEEERPVDAVDRDVDQLMGSFLDRMEAFLSPANAPVTAFAAADPGHLTPFERVARAKAQLLDVRDKAEPPLLRGMASVFAEGGGTDASETKAAQQEFRDACAIHLRRFYDVGSVVVKPLGSQIENGWIVADGAQAPKLYGQLTFGTKKDVALGFRALTRGIPLSAGQMTIAIAVLPELESDFVDLGANGAVAYELTHIERALKRTADNTRLSPSSWLTIVPLFNKEGSTLSNLPTVALSKEGQQLIAPLIRRRVPQQAHLDRPTVNLYDDDPEPTTYGEEIARARRWTFGFNVTAEFLSTDDVCGRIIYNGPLGGAHHERREATTAAPRFRGLFEALVTHEHQVAPYWQVIITEGTRQSGDPVGRFRNACNRFAESVESVVNVLKEASFEAAPLGISEDRFVLKDEKSGNGRKTSIEFVDHLVDRDLVKGKYPVWPVMAGEGKPWLRIRQIDINDKPHPAQTPSLGGKHGGLSDNPVGGIFVFDKDDNTGLVRHREVQIGRLDALKQHSVWVAVSVRRNDAVNGQLVRQDFVYRTAEIYLQELMVPSLKRRRTIRLAHAEKTTLSSLLLRALQPVFAGIGDRPYPIQLRLDYESGRIVEIIETAFGHLADTPSDAFLPEPDPKIMLAGLAVVETGSAGWSLGLVAEELSTRLRAALGKEQIGRRSDKSRGCLVLNITIRTAEKDQRLGQPLLHLERLVIDLAAVSDF